MLMDTQICLQWWRVMGNMLVWQSAKYINVSADYPTISPFPGVGLWLFSATLYRSSVMCDQVQIMLTPVLGYGKSGSPTHKWVVGELDSWPAGLWLPCHSILPWCWVMANLWLPSYPLLPHHPSKEHLHWSQPALLCPAWQFTVALIKAVSCRFNVVLT